MNVNATANRDPIIVVDDDAPTRMLLSRQLEHGGYRTLSAEGPSEAKALLEESRCCLMLCDLKMPQGSGLQLVEDVLPQHPDLAVLMISATDDGDAAEAAVELGAYGYMIKPVAKSQLLINVSGALRRRELEIENRANRQRLQELVDQRTLALGEAVRRVEGSARELRHSREETIRRLSRAGEYRDEESGEHVARIGRICYLLARRLGLEPDHCELIRLASPLHDIGKVGIGDPVLRKPGALDEEERVIMQTHTEIGYEILAGSNSPLLELAATIARTHHENFDGSGYPRGLAGEEIPIEGRIVAVADVFDALTHDRIYRPAMPIERALEIMRDGGGSQFDQAVLDAFFEQLPEITEIAISEEGGAGVRVLVVEDHAAVRKGIELLLRNEGFAIVGTASDAEQAHPLIERRLPEVVVIDVFLPGESGIELARRLLAREGAPRVLLYTAAEDEETIRKAIDAGAAGVASKAAPARELTGAIRDVARGKTYLDPRLEPLMARSRGGAQSILTPREQEVLGLLAGGLTGDQVAAELFLSPETVRTHVRNAMNKLAARTRVHAVTEALRRREISL